MRSHITERERYLIEAYLKDGLTPYVISKKLNRPNVTIYREISRGSVVVLNSDLTTTTRYFADVGQRIKNERGHNKGRNLAIGNNLSLANRIEELIIEKRYSPYCALEICKKEGLNVNICLSTLYNYVYGGLFYKLNPKHLIYKRHINNNRAEERRIARNNIKGSSIEIRPKYIYKRKEFGHWEMDSVVGKQGTNESLIVLTERLSRYELIYKVSSKTIDNTISILNKLEQQFKEKFPLMFKTITCDNGSEFLNQQGMEQSIINSHAKRTSIYYCHPYCSSERGSNENANRIIRRFISKGSDISTYSNDYIAKVQDYINNMPRKLFNGKCSKDLATEYGFV